MVSECDKIEKASMLLDKIARGIEPLSGEPIRENSFLNDPKIIRCFYFICEILDNVKKGVYNSRKLTDFVVTDEQKGMVKLPEQKIGVNEFSRCVNQCLDLSVSKKLTGSELNRRLKKMGILGEESLPLGKTRTVTNDKSGFYGFESEKREYNGVEYDMVVINDTGKRYLLDELESIMAVGI